MTKRIAILIVVLTASLVQAQSLQETEHWMSNTLKPNSFYKIDMRNVQLQDDYVVLSSSFNGCSASVTEQHLHVDGVNPSSSYNAERIYTLSLAEIDPNSIQIRQGTKIEGNVGFSEVQFSTTNSEPRLKETTVEFDSIKGKTERISTESNHPSMSLGVSSNDYAFRFAKALKHAVTLCGGKASAF